MFFGWWDLCLLVLTLIGLILLYFWNQNQFFKRKGVNHLTPQLLFGNTLDVMREKRHLSDVNKEAQDAFPDDRYVGIYNFTNPLVLILDLELIKNVTVKDFDHFVDHMPFTDEDVDPTMGKSLFALNEDRWREMRTTLSPAFTSAKMRGMLPLILECTDNLVEYLNKEIEHPSAKEIGYVEIEIKDLIEHLTNDVIASCAFGYKINSIADQKNKFYTLAKKFTQFSNWDNLKLMAFFMFSSVFKIFNLKLRSEEITSFFRDVVMSNIKMREEKNIVRQDMIHLLMLAKKGALQAEKEQGTDSSFATVKKHTFSSKSKKIEWSDDDILAQAMIFLFAGLDTTSNGISHLLHRLAVHDDIRNKLQQEVDDYMLENDGKIEYLSLNKLTYLDMVLSESLRIWPPVPFLDRMCVKPYTLPPQNDNGGVSHEMKKGDLLFIPNYVIQHDPKYYPDPEKFIPERFSEENKSKINPYSYLPFGYGPRACIGSRFAILEIKIAVVKILANFDIVATPKTDSSYQIKPHFFEMLPVKGFWIGLKKRDK